MRNRLNETIENFKELDTVEKIVAVALYVIVPMMLIIYAMSFAAAVYFVVRYPFIVIAIALAVFTIMIPVFEFMGDVFNK